MYYPLSPNFSVDLDFLREWFLWQLGGGGGGGGGWGVATEGTVDLHSTYGIQLELSRLHVTVL
jgi:hypothetical protein